MRKERGRDKEGRRVTGIGKGRILFGGSVNVMT
jgi:hypothetical protein